MKKRILIADDDPMIVTLVSLRLETENYEIATAMSGPEALAQIHRHLPHAAILDVQMPGRGGLAVLEDIRADPMLAALQVMILTGERNPGTVIKALAAGAADYMVKPFNPDMLAERVARMIRNAPAAAPGAMIQI